MRIAASVLSRYVTVPTGKRALRDLFDDLGLEVKRAVEKDHPNGFLDPHFTLELLANRGDHHCYLGLAREIRGRTGAELKMPALASLEVGPAPVEVFVETPLCLVYSATVLERHGDSVGFDEDVLAPLIAAELHSVSAPVDATNLSNLEVGQPTHAFDADTIVGAIRIRTSRAGEKAWPLFTAGPIELPAGTMVIADDDKVLAIAGVIGCEESKTQDTTRRLVLESACFDPVSVRRTSRALGIHTDSVTRFERGSDPLFPLVGAARVVHLLESTGAWRRVGPTRIVGDWTDPARQIELDVDAAAAFLELPLSAGIVTERLTRLGFQVQAVSAGRLRVRVPPHRLWDVEYVADLYEELARSLGYGETPERLPPVDLGALPSAAEVAKARTEEVLVGNGFYEVFTDGFYARDVRDRLGIGEGHPLHAHVETQNALDRAYSLLKNNALAQAVEATAENHRRRVEAVRLFEWTRTFHPDRRAENGLCSERALLWAIVSGPDRDPTWAHTHRAADFYFLKGLVEELEAELRVGLVVGPPDPSAPLASCLHPFRQAAIRQNGRTVGIVGDVHPAVCKAHKLKRAAPVYLEVDVAALREPARPVSFDEPTELQPIVRNLAFSLPRRVTAGEVAGTLRESGPQWLVAVDVVDRFDHELDGVPVRTMTFALTFANAELGRTAEEVNAAADALVGAVHARYADQGVRLR